MAGMCGQENLLAGGVGLSREAGIVRRKVRVFPDSFDAERAVEIRTSGSPESLAIRPERYSTIRVGDLVHHPINRAHLRLHTLA